MWRAALVLVLLLGGAAAQPPGAAPEAWWLESGLDVDADGVDDALEPRLLGDAPLVVLVAYARHPGASERAALERAGFEVVFAPTHFDLLAAEGPASRVRGLLDLPGVVFVEENAAVDRALAQSVPLIGAPRAWSTYAATGKGVAVAVLDDGAFEQHPDLQPKLAGHYDASRREAVGGSDVGVVAPAGEQGHATHVAGIVVGTGGESGGRYRGVAPDAVFVNVKVFEGPNRTSSDIVLRGLDWTISNMERLGIRVAVMSLGGRASDGTDALSRSVDVAVDKGLIVVAASGNTGPEPGTITTPGAARKAVTVGAVDKQKSLASFSSRGPMPDGSVKPEIVAPGVQVTSTVPPASTSGIGGLLGGGTTYYAPLSGSSMAAPHVAGVVALMLEANPALSPFLVKQILVATAQDLAATGLDNETGYGFVNAVAAVQVAKEPRLLDSPRLAARLATLPEPTPASPLDRLAFEAQALVRSGDPLRLGVAVVGSLLLIGLLAGALRRR